MTNLNWFHVTPNIGRRTFLKGGALILTAGNILTDTVRAESSETRLKFGLVTDLHYADKPAAGSRYYRETPEKLAEAAAYFGKHAPTFVVELGDFIDAAKTVATEMQYLKRINHDFAAICPQRHYVLGNHCVYTLNKQEFLYGVEQAKSYYSFDVGEFHFVVLDSCFRSDGTPYGRRNFEWTDPNIPAAEIEWLKADLAATKKMTVVFAHQRLDVSNHHGVKNGADVRRVLEKSQKVTAVFQGHSHHNDLKEIGGIHYCTLAAMIEGSGPDNNGYSLVSVTGDGTIRVDGFRRQADYVWS